MDWLARFILIVVLADLLVQTANAQNAFGAIQSVSQYASCLESPLADQTTIASGVTGAPTQGANSGCAAFSDGTLTVIRLRITANRQKGAQLLVFTIGDLPPTGMSVDYTLSKSQILSCIATGVGDQCNALLRKLVLTFESTRLFGERTILKQPSPLPYAILLSSNVNVNTECDPDRCSATEGLCCGATGTNIANEPIPYYSSKVSCDLADRSGFQQINPGFRKTQSTSACPARLSNPDLNAFYDGPYGRISDFTTAGECAVTYCKIPTPGNAKDRVTATVVQTISPMCAWGVVQTNARALMAASIYLGSLSYENNRSVVNTERLDLSTRAGSMPVQSAKFPVVAQLNNVNLGGGVVDFVFGGPSIVVECNHGGPGNPLGLQDDMPGLVPPQLSPQTGLDQRTIFQTFYNPYIDTNLDGETGISENEKTGCMYPASVCRRMFIPKWVADTDPQEAMVGNYYIANEGRLPEYSNTPNCNKNGLTGKDFSLQKILRPFCVAQAEAGFSLNNGTFGNGVAGVCVPGYNQETSATAGLMDVISATTTYTPCMAAQTYAKMLVDANALANAARGGPPVDVSTLLQPNFVPVGSNPRRQNFWLNGMYVITEAFAGATDEPSLDISVYVGGTLDSSITPISAGTFLEGSMRCDATTGGPGNVAWVTQTSSNIGGTFFVSVTFEVPTGGEDADISIAGTKTTFNVGGQDISTYGKSGQWPARNSNQSGIYRDSLNFIYSGPLGNYLIANLSLYIFVPVGGVQGYLLVDQLSTGCTITKGTVADLATFDNRSGVLNGVDLSGDFGCPEWYYPIWKCIGKYRRRWMPVVWIAIVGTLLPGALAAVLMLPCFFCKVCRREKKVENKPVVIRTDEPSVTKTE